MTAQAAFPAPLTGLYFEGERPHYAARDRLLEGLRIGPGDSALKHGRNLVVREADFAGKYPFWHCETSQREPPLRRRLQGEPASQRAKPRAGFVGQPRGKLP